MRFSSRISFIIAPFVLFTASAQPAPTAEAILAAADSAIAATKTASYYASMSTIGVDGKEFQLGTKIHLVRLDESNDIGWKIRFDLDGGAIAYDGRQALYLNDAIKKLTTLDSTSSFRQTMDGNVVGNLVNNIFRCEEPFSSLAPHARYEGIKSMHEEECHVILVTVPDDEEITETIGRYYFSTSDYILRSRTASAKYHGLPSSSTYTFSRVKLNRPIPDSTFTIATPEGYAFETMRPYRPSPPLAVGATAPDWSLPDTAGTMVSLADLKGKVIVIDFWYITCPPCIRVMPKLAKLQQQFGREDVRVIGINTIDDAERAKDFMRAKGFNYGLLSNGKRAAKDYQVSVFPTMYVIGRDGKIAYVHAGDSEDLEQSLGDAIRKELEKK